MFNRRGSASGKGWMLVNFYILFLNGGRIRRLMIIVTFACSGHDRYYKC